MIFERPVHQCFRVTLNRSQGRAQLMGYIDYEVFSYALQFFQLAVLSLELLDGALQVLAGFFELHAEYAQLALIRGIETRTIVAFSQLAGEGDDGPYPL